MKTNAEELISELEDFCETSQICDCQRNLLKDLVAECSDILKKLDEVVSYTNSCQSSEHGHCQKCYEYADCVQCSVCNVFFCEECALDLFGYCEGPLGEEKKSDQKDEEKEYVQKELKEVKCYNRICKDECKLDGTHQRWCEQCLILNKRKNKMV